MKNSQRKPVHKSSSAKHFSHQSAKTHPRNISPPPRRGGYRL